MFDSTLVDADFFSFSSLFNPLNEISNLAPLSNSTTSQISLALNSNFNINDYSYKTGDFNGDGRDDVYFHWQVSGINRLYLSQGNGTFIQYEDPIGVTAINGSPDNALIGDYNGDGRDDVYFHWKVSGINRLYLSQGNGTFIQYEDPIGVTAINGSPDNALVGDFNGDGRDDVYFHWNNGTNRLYLSQGNGIFTQYLNTISPDLLFGSYSAPDSATAGSIITVNYTLRNQGNSSADYHYTDFYLSQNTILDGTDTRLGQVAESALATGTSRNGTKSLTLSSGLSGTYYLLYKADGNNQISESNETIVNL